MTAVYCVSTAKKCLGEVQELFILGVRLTELTLYDKGLAIP